MLAQEFSIPYEDKEPPSHRKPPQETPEQRFRRMERYCFRVLCDYRNLLCRWKPLCSGLRRAWSPLIRAS